MGMFDYVNVRMDCPKCGEPLQEFQSKDSICCIEIVSPVEVRNFYTSCRKCKSWIEFTRAAPEREEVGPPMTREQVEEMGFKWREDLLDGLLGKKKGDK